MATLHVGSEGVGSDGQDGVVGIGTLNPITILEIAKSVDGEFRALTLSNDHEALNDIVSLGFSQGSHPTTGVNVIKTTIGHVRKASYGRGDLVFAFNNDANATNVSLLTGEKMRITRNGDVGIGTPNPITILEIAKSVDGEFKALALSNDSEIDGNTVSLGFSIGSTGGTNLLKSAIGHIRKDTYGKGDLIFAVDSNADANNVELLLDEKMRITADGNVGIGTTEPVSKLHLKDDMLRIERATAGDDVWALGVLVTGEASSRLLINSKGYIRWSGGEFAPDTNLFREDENKLRTNSHLIIDGNVGIGTINPMEKLVVISGAGVNVATFKNTAIDNNIFLNAPSGNKNKLVFGLGETNYARIVLDGADFNKLKITDGSENPWLTIDQSGNVGIGTPNPSSFIDAERLGISGDNINILELTNRCHESDMGVNTRTSVLFKQWRWDDVFGYKVNDAGSLVTGIESLQDNLTINSYLAFKTGFTNGLDTILNERMRITSEGRVGINTIDPTAQLNVIGINGIDTDAPDVLTVIGGRGGNGNYKGGKVILQSGDGGNGAICGPGGDVEILAGSGGAIGGSQGDGGHIKIQGGSGLVPGNVLLAYEQGNVGIGLINPTEKLDVQGNIKLQNGNWLGTGTPSAQFPFLANGIYFEPNATLQKLYVGGAAGSSSRIEFHLSPDNSLPTEKMRITGDGRVGIGTTNPDAASKLDVAGQIKIREGNPGSGKVLTSDANGLASWGSIDGSGIVDYSIDGSIKLAPHSVPRIKLADDIPLGYLGALVSRKGDITLSTTDQLIGGFSIPIGGVFNTDKLITLNISGWAEIPPSHQVIIYVKSQDRNGNYVVVPCSELKLSVSDYASWQTIGAIIPVFQLSQHYSIEVYAKKVGASATYLHNIVLSAICVEYFLGGIPLPPVP